MTMRAGDIYLSPTARDTQTLLTVWALEIPMGFTILKTQTCIAQARTDRPPPTEEALIFRITHLNIAREHTEIAKQQKRQNEGAHPSPAGDPLNHQQHQTNQQQRIIQLVAAISPSHHAAQKIHHSASSFPAYANIISSTSSRPSPFSAENGITGTSSGNSSVCRISARLPAS